MTFTGQGRAPQLRTGLLAACLTAAACGPATRSAPVPPAPIVGHLPDVTYLPERQCQGRYAADQLQRYLPRARLALWLPGTRAVALDSSRGCITITVESLGDGRLAELVLRGMAVPRRSVLLLLSNDGARST